MNSTDAIKTFKFSQSPYTFTGSFDSDRALKEATFSELLDSALDFTVRKRRPDVRTTPGRSAVWYDHGAKITFTWVMQSGDPLTYGECGEVISLFVQLLRSHISFHYDDSPGRTVISVGSLLKIIIVVEVFSTNKVNIGENRGLHLNSWFYDRASLSSDGILSVLNGLAAHSAAEDPSALVPARTIRTDVSQDVVGVFKSSDPMDRHPEYTWEELRMLMQQIYEYYLRGYKRSPISGTIETHEDDPRGALYLERRFEFSTEADISNTPLTERD